MKRLIAFNIFSVNFLNSNNSYLVFEGMSSSANKTPASVKKRAPDMNLVSCERAARGVWLVKVPKYLSEIWQKNEGNAIGSLITGKDVVFKSDPDLRTEDKAAAVQFKLF